MLPPIKDVKLQSLTLPTAWQTVIFRNYGYVDASRIADVLGCDVDVVYSEARRLGLSDACYCDRFDRSGYITVIRNNWYLLPYDQLLTLLGFEAARLDYVLEKEDFLSVKLGGMKPKCESVRYFPLSREQLEKTESIASRVRSLDGKASAPFDFFPDAEFSSDAAPADRMRIVHGYLSPCGDPFLTDCSDTLSRELLARYRAAGVNGIWLHGVLSGLSPYPFCPSLSEGYRERRENLKKVVARCKEYGIKLYIYLNEPRALPEEVMDKYGHLVGWKERRTLCIEKEEVRAYLYEAVRDLCADVLDLGGIFTITMSENPTHCNYLRNTTCPVCKNIPPEVGAAAVNNIIYRAMRDSGCKGELIANLWGWSPVLGWSDEQISHGLELLDKEISVVCVSEYDLEIEKGGVKGKVIDYSISNPGPSEITLKTLKRAKELGHRIYAKIQASNSWECSAVPYIPVFDLVAEHLENLYAIGVNDLFLTWTHGGYPSPSIGLASEYKPGADLDLWYKERYGERAGLVHEGVRLLCDAFREYPFSLSALYFSPKSLGPANLWELLPEEKRSTMVCYAFDDVETWIKPYPDDVYVSQMKKLTSLWQRGIALLKDIPHTDAINELVRYAEAAYVHFASDLYLTEFSLYKRKGELYGMRACVNAEKENTESLLRLMRSDARIGYEASNHYFYTERNLIEKIIRMESFDAELSLAMRG